MNTLQISNLCKSYKRTQALRSVSLTLPSGSTALLGPNGAGKTTLIRILATLLEPDSGSIHMGNLDWSNPRKIRSQIGYLPQNFSFYKYLSVRESLEYIAVLKKIPESEQRNAVDTLLAETNLEECQRKRIHQLSGGMCRRLGIAQALLGNPEILLVDEPTASLDPHERIRLRNLLLAKAANRFVLVSTHIAEDAESICSHAALLNHGQIAAFGGVAEIKELAQGKVFEAQIPAKDYDSFISNANISVIRFKPLDANWIAVRYVGESSGGNPVEPSLEDAYVFLIGSEAKV